MLQKYRLSSSDRKSQNSFDEPGHYSPSVRQNSSAVYPSGGHSKLKGESFDSPSVISDSGSVFTFTNDSCVLPKDKDVPEGTLISLSSRKGDRNSVTQEAGETSSSRKPRRRRCVILQFLFVFLGLAAVIALILAFEVFHVGGKIVFIFEYSFLHILTLKHRLVLFCSTTIGLSLYIVMTVMTRVTTVYMSMAI